MGEIFPTEPLGLIEREEHDPANRVLLQFTGILGSHLVNQFPHAGAFWAWGEAGESNARGPVQRTAQPAEPEHRP